ncbi:MAG: hypothetical protein ACI8RD_010684 [Bacillariaceae sp.]|jgi:hypothetical protein
MLFSLILQHAVANSKFDTNKQRSYLMIRCALLNYKNRPLELWVQEKLDRYFVASSKDLV